MPPQVDEGGLEVLALPGRSGPTNREHGEGFPLQGQGERAARRADMMWLACHQYAVDERNGKRNAVSELELINPQHGLQGLADYVDVWIEMFNNRTADVHSVETWHSIRKMSTDNGRACKGFGNADVCL